MEQKVEVSDIFHIQEGDKPNSEEFQALSNNIIIGKISDIIKLYFSEDTGYNYDNVSKQHINDIKEHFSNLHWLDQIKVRLAHIGFKEILFPQIHDKEGFKFIKKNHDVFSKKVTVYYYCEAYPKCPMGMKFNFIPKTFDFIEATYIRNKEHDMNYEHKYHKQVNLAISNEVLSLETEQQQKKFLEKKAMSDPFRANLTSCHREIHKMSQGKVGSLLSMEKSREIFQNAKNKLLFPRVSIENLRYVKNYRDQLFCQKIVFRGDSTFVFLCSEDQIKLLNEFKPKQFFLDGYHKVPKEFKQLVSMFGFAEAKQGAFAVFHCLLNKKTEKDYEIMLEEFLILLQYYLPDYEFAPEIFTTDFERGLLNSIEKIFPTSKQSGCFFHFIQCQIRHFTSLGLLKGELKKNLSTFGVNKIFYVLYLSQR